MKAIPVDLKITRLESQRVLALCGMAGPIAYAVVVAVLGYLEPDYSHVTQSMSELGAVCAQYAVVMNTAGLPLLGVLLMAFALGLLRGVVDSRTLRVGTALVALSGFSLVMTAVFPCDPGCIDVSTTGKTHSVFATIAAFALLVGNLFLAPAVWRDNRWRGYARYTFASAMVAMAVSALYGLGLIDGLDGALQRASMGVSLVWVEVMAVRLWYTG